MQQDLEIVSMIKVNGEWVNQEDLLPEEAVEIIGKTMDRAMANIGYQKVKTA